MATTKAKQAEIDAAIVQLKGWIKPGDTVYTILESVSRSGMSRQIRVIVPYSREQCERCGAPAYPDRWDGGDAYARPEGWRCRIGEPCEREGCEGRIGSVIDHLHPNHSVGLVTGYRLAKRGKGDGLIVGGCGMDMGFALVYSVSSRLYGGAQCTCGYWVDPVDGAHYSSAASAAKRTGDGWHWEYAKDCTRCHGSGNVIGTGYQCLGKGKCPSNYHSNHRDRLQCEGVIRDGERVRCGRPNRGSFAGGREDVPADWPMGKIDIGDTGESIEYPLHTLFTPDGEYGREVCPACAGAGDVANPDGPERFDLEHFDGYAIRHRWM